MGKTRKWKARERGRRLPSFWVTGTTRLESVDIATCQIWPIRGYTRSWRPFKEMIMGSAAPPLLSFLPFFFFFFFHIRAFSIQWTRLSRSLEQASQLILGDHFLFFRMAKLKKSHNFTVCFPFPKMLPRVSLMACTTYTPQRRWARRNVWRSQARQSAAALVHCSFTFKV